MIPTSTIDVDEDTETGERVAESPPGGRRERDQWWPTLVLPLARTPGRIRWWRRGGGGGGGSDDSAIEWRGSCHSGVQVTAVVQVHRRERPEEAVLVEAVPDLIPIGELADGIDDPVLGEASDLVDRVGECLHDLVVALPHAVAPILFEAVAGADRDEVGDERLGGDRDRPLGSASGIVMRLPESRRVPEIMS